MSGPINVIASEAKQSSFLCFASRLDCFFARTPLRKRFAFVAGNDGATGEPGIPALPTIPVFGADIRQSQRYINPARHVRAFDVRMGIGNDGIDTIERRLG